MRNKRVETVETVLVWTCAKCNIGEVAEPPYTLGDYEPCIYCDGTSKVEDLNAVLAQRTRFAKTLQDIYETASNIDRIQTGEILEDLISCASMAEQALAATPKTLSEAIQKARGGEPPTPLRGYA